MTETCCDDAVGGDPLWPPLGRVVRVEGLLLVEPRLVVRSAIGADRFAFQPGDRFADGGLAGVDDRSLDAWIVGDGVQHAGRFRQFECQIEPWDAPGRGAELVAVRVKATGAGGEPSEHGAQIVGAYVAGQVESCGSPAEPLANGFAGAGVVVVEGLGDSGEVVGLLADSEFGDRQHGATTHPTLLAMRPRRLFTLGS